MPKAGQCVLRGEGFEFAAPAWLTRQQLPPERTLTVGIRPQHLQACSLDAAQLTLRVDVVEYLGTESQVVGHLQTPGGQRVSAMVPGNALALLHQPLGLTFAIDDLHIFDTVSGQRLH